MASFSIVVLLAICTFVTVTTAVPIEALEVASTDKHNVALAPAEEIQEIEEIEYDVEEGLDRKGLSRILGTITRGVKKASKKAVRYSKKVGRYLKIAGKWVNKYKDDIDGVVTFTQDQLERFWVKKDEYADKEKV